MKREGFDNAIIPRRISPIVRKNLTKIYHEASAETAPFNETLEVETQPCSFGSKLKNFLEDELGAVKIPQLTSRTKVEKKSQAISKDNLKREYFIARSTKRFWQSVYLCSRKLDLKKGDSMYLQSPRPHSRFEYTDQFRKGGDNQSSECVKNGRGFKYFS